MKYLWYSSFVFLLIFLFAACDKDDPEPTPLPANTYNVNYSISIFGGYNQMQLWYFTPGNLKQYEVNPKLPLEEYFYNFNILDSVGLNLTVVPMPNRSMYVNYNVNITKDTSYLSIYSFSDTIVTGPNPDTLYFSYGGRID
jgi:hypothetical protein